MTPGQPEAGWRSPLLWTAMKHREQRGMSQRKWAKGKVDLLWGKPLLLGQRLLLKVKSFGMEKRTERKGHNLGPPILRWAVGSEDVVLSWRGWLVMDPWRALHMMNSERKPDGLQHCTITLVLITPAVKMGLCFQILVPAGILQIFITSSFPKTSAHWGWLCWSWCSSSSYRQQFRAASAGVTLVFEASKWAQYLGSEKRKKGYQNENRVRVIDQFTQEDWTGPSVCFISSGFPSLQILLDNCPVHQPSHSVVSFVTARSFQLTCKRLFSSSDGTLLCLPYFRDPQWGQISCWVSALRCACCWLCSCLPVGTCVSPPLCHGL